MKRNIALLQSEKMKKVQALANYYQESIDLPPGKNREAVIKKINESKKEIKEINDILTDIQKEKEIKESFVIIDGFTLLLFLFVVVMYGYFYFVRKSIVIPAAKHPTTKYLVAFFSLMILANAFSAGDKIEMIRSVLYILIIFSFLYDARGFAEDCIITHPFDNRGTAFKDIEKIVLVQKPNGIRLGYLKKAEEGWFYAFLRH